MQAIGRLRLLKDLVNAEILPGAALYQVVEAATLRIVNGSNAICQPSRLVFCVLDEFMMGVLLWSDKRLPTQVQSSTLRGLLSCDRSTRLASHSGPGNTVHSSTLSAQRNLGAFTLIVP